MFRIIEIIVFRIIEIILFRIIEKGIRLWVNRAKSYAIGGQCGAIQNSWLFAKSDALQKALQSKQR